MRILATALLAAAVCGSLAAGEPRYSDWPHWLGPDRDGSSPETGLLREWPEGGPEVLWKAPLGKTYEEGRGYGTPTVSRGQVFLLANGAKPGASYLCLDAFTGKLVWQHTYEWKDKGGAGHPPWGNCTKGSVAVTEKRVYGVDDLGVVTCLDRATGAPVWSRDLDLEFKPNHYDWKGWCMTPVVLDGVVVLSLDQFYGDADFTDARIIGLDVETGKTVWLREYHYKRPNKLSKIGGGHYQTPAVVDFGGEKCVLFSSAVKKPDGGGTGGLVALRPSDGKVVWECSDGTGELCTIQTPFVRGDFVMLLNTWQPIRGYQLSHSRQPFGLKPLWTCAEVKSSYAATVFRDGYLYTFTLNGITSPLDMVCVEAATGKVAWKEKRKEFLQCVSLMLADGLLYVRGSNKLLLVEATPAAFTLKGELDMGFSASMANAGWVMPSLAYGRLYVRTDKELWCIRVAERLPSAEDAARSLARGAGK